MGVDDTQSITAAPEAPLHHTNSSLFTHQADGFPLGQRARPDAMDDPPDLPVFTPAVCVPGLEEGCRSLGSWPRTVFITPLLTFVASRSAVFVGRLPGDCG
jgi:hypothetical protein